MYTLELARANVDELLREARRTRGNVPTRADHARFAAVRRLTR